MPWMYQTLFSDVILLAHAYIYLYSTLTQMIHEHMKYDHMHVIYTIILIIPVFEVLCIHMYACVLCVCMYAVVVYVSSNVSLPPLLLAAASIDHLIKKKLGVYRSLTLVTGLEKWILYNVLWAVVLFSIIM